MAQIVELIVDKSSVAGYLQDSNDVSTGSCSISTVGSRCYGMAGEDNRLQKA
jgi:hypothetical protein